MNKKGKGKGKKRPVREPSIPPPKPSGRKRKPQQHTLSDDDLAEAGPSSPIGNCLPHNQNPQTKEKNKPKKAKKKKKD